MKFRYINAADVPRIAMFPADIDMRMRAVLCEIDDEHNMLTTSLIHPTTGDYVVRVFALVPMPEAAVKAGVLVAEHTGFLNYVQAKAHARAVARYWYHEMTTEGGQEPGKDLTFPADDLLAQYAELEDSFPSGMELSVERMSQQTIAVFMAGVKPEQHMFPFAVKNATLALPVYLTMAIESINRKQAQTNKPGRPLKVGDLMITNSDDIPMFAALWIIGNIDDKGLVVRPLDPTFDVGKWCTVPVADHRKGLEHCFEKGLYEVSGKFKGMVA